tara:strand:+ start:232 stop:777 length:546 start_codon:yes stop_codon:yes gene_type:complete
MIYNKPTKAEDGMRHVAAFTDEKKRCFIQLPCVKVLDTDSEMGEVSFEITGEENQAKIESVHESSIESAVENAVEWFGKELPEKTVTNAYTKEECLSTDKIEATRVFNSKNEQVDFETLSPGTTCSIFVEFSGLWFARKAFGPSWNIVQVKINEEEKKGVEETQEIEAYPDGCMFENSDSK